MASFFDGLPEFAEKWRRGWRPPGYKGDAEEGYTEPLQPLQPFGGSPLQGEPSAPSGEAMPEWPRAAPDTTPPDPGWSNEWRDMWRDMRPAIPPQAPAIPPGRRYEANAGGLLGNLGALTGSAGTGLLGSAGGDDLGEPGISASGFGLLPPSGGESTDTLPGGAGDDGSAPSMFNRLFGGGGRGDSGGSSRGAWGPALMQLGGGIAAGATEGWGSGIGKGLSLAGGSLQRSREQEADEQYKRDVLAQRQQEADAQLALEKWKFEHPEATALARNLRDAGLDPGSPEFQKAMLTAITKPETSINLGEQVDPLWGKPPENSVWLRDENNAVVTEKVEGGVRPRAVPIGGTKLEAEQTAAAEAEKKRDKETQRTANVMSEDIGRALNIIDTSEGVTGFPGAAAASVPGTPAHNLSKMLDGIKANIGFDRLQQMRAASPTGAALGAVQVRELELLQAVYGSVEQSQTKEQLKFNLQRLRTAFDEVINGPPMSRIPGAPPRDKVPSYRDYFGVQ